MAVAIRVENLSKKYKLGQKVGYRTLRDTIMKIFRMRSDEDGFIWALKDVNFEVEEGEVLGIIGPNGAGKTTLLKVLSRVTPPTSGKFYIKGRVGALLEVGTGFHSELTGRENVYLSGAILGMNKQEIERKFDEIVEFAGVEDFIETPVKYYSTGMRVRLGFAVAAHLETDILLVDEVLAVGDISFQKKCLEKMGDVAKGGRTVLFVSHNMLAVQSLCKRAILLRNGQIFKEGEVNFVISSYLSEVVEMKTERVWEDINTAPGNRWAKIRSVKVKFDPVRRITTRTPFDIEVDYWLLKSNARVGITLQIINEQGVVALVTGTGIDPNSPRNKNLPAGLYRSTLHIPGGLLNASKYVVNLVIVRWTEHSKCDGVIAFEIVDETRRLSGHYGKNEGVINPELPWKTEPLEIFAQT